MKRLFSLTKLGLFVLLCCGFILAGCENGTSPSPAPTPKAGKGVVGEISGVLYDSLSIQPIEGVTVNLDGSKTVTTDANGAYRFTDVIVGDHIVSFRKDGYQFKTQDVFVDPEDYKNDDPFGEYEALQDQLAALRDWVNHSDIPDYTGSGDNLTWTYQGNGVFVNGDGAQVQVTYENGQFEVREYKMNFDYVKSYNIAITELAPLTGAIKGSIRLFKTPYVDSLDVKLEEDTPIGAGIKVWLREAVGAQAVGTAVNDEAVYGPVITDENGNFSFTHLPVGVNLTLVIEGFTTENGYAYAYRNGGAFYVYDYDEFDLLATVAARNNGIAATAEEQTYTDLGTFYLFTEGSFAIITESDAGSPVAPKNPADPITLTFNKAIDPAKFAASLLLENTAVAPTPPTTATINFSAVWNTEFTTVTLKPAQPVGGQLQAALPYSVDGSLTIGELNISGKAADGSIIYADNTGAIANNTGIPVFTVEGLKLINFEHAPTGIPARMAISSSAVKLTFNKPLSATPGEAAFDWGNGTTIMKEAEYNINGEVVYVYTDHLTVGGDDALNYRVTSASDPRDTVAGVLDPDGDGFGKPAQQKLTLESTNIYAGDPNAVGTGPIGANAKFPVNGNITLTFTKNIPTDAVVLVSLVNGGAPSDTANSMHVEVTKAGKTVTINPSTNLPYGDQYWLAVEIWNGGECLFGSNQLALAANNKLIEIDDDGGDPAYNSITFNIEEEVIAAALDNAASNGGTSDVFTIAGDSITATGKELKLNTSYYVHFDKPVTLTYPNGINNQRYNTTEDELQIRVTLSEDGKVMEIRVVLTNTANPATLPLTVDIDFNGGTNLVNNAATNGGRINTASRNFSISGLTVVNP